MDYSLFRVINGLAGRSPVLDSIMAWVAEYMPAVLVLVVVYAWFAGPAQGASLQRAVLLRAVLSAAAALGLNVLIGLVYYRPRPFVTHAVKLLLPKVEDNSFPSDHAAFATALTASAVPGLPRRSLVGRLAAAVMILAAALGLFARVYVGLHYPFDVVGGVVTGLAGGFGTRLAGPWLNPLTARIVDAWEATWAPARAWFRRRRRSRRGSS